ncbi:MAG TPA: PIG-L family deacetylase [Candidatus Udaeobacter sp.]|nr:PIG-L family deacetylase [Candidatus Udaeobacter sp.]
MSPGVKSLGAAMPQRILVLAPHPDDEVVGAAVAARRAIAGGAEVFALYLTTGVPAAAVLWPWQRPGHGARVKRRREEALQAAGRIGLKPAGFLDWPSRSLKSHLAEAEAAIADAIAAHGIAALWTPAWEGAHQDHDATNFLAARFAGGLPVLEFAEYNYAGGKLRSGEFPPGGEAAGLLELTPEEISWKRRLLACYASERGNLAHIRLVSEAFRPLPAHDYGGSPHPGTLFWERYHWVPLRHPRIDFTRPGELRAALTAYAKANPVRPHS